MNFNYMSYIFLVLFLFFVFAIITLRYEKNFFTWVKDYWFYQRSLVSKVSSILYLCGFFVLFISMLDLRGPEEQVVSNIVDQKTIVIIDSSASMLVEDVRPNRFQKALLMARHFVKKSVGHQIAIVVFSDTQKRLIPFTDDLDLLDSRIAAMSDLRINNGGSNIIQAIRESSQYFEIERKENEAIFGNILLFTDSEDNGQMDELKLPESINLAVVAVGTKKGGGIPIRDPNGRLRGHKTYKGKEVISKIDESFLKKLGTQIKNYKYWIALSYSIPTESILSFFRTQFKSKMSKGNIRIKPVKGYDLIAFGILLLTLSYILRLRRNYVLPLFLLMTFSYNVKAQNEKEDIDPVVKKEIDSFRRKDKAGKLDKRGRLKLAELLLRANKVKDAVTLYDENINSFEHHTHSELFNYGTILLKSSRFNEGVVVLNHIKDRLNDSENSQKLKDLINKNILKAIEEEEKKQKKKGDQKEKSDKKNEDDKKSDKKKEESKNSKNKKGKGKEGKEEKEKDKDKKKGKSKDKDQDAKKKKGQQSLEEKEEEIKKKRKMVKIPAVIKQILNDDRALQKKYWKTSTQTNSHDKKDW